jgi:predicted transposase/invertase (TIGR01784 family)
MSILGLLPWLWGLFSSVILGILWIYATYTLSLFAESGGICMCKEIVRNVRKPLTELTLLDRFLFAETMENPENMNIVLDIILDNELQLRGKPQTEKELRRSSVYRYAKLDVWAEDMDDTLYDTEVQRENTYNLPKRFRYYQGLIDSQLLKPGENDFNKLNRLYQIMIMPFDLFGYEKYCYTFENQCLEVPGLEIKDDVTWIFLNTHGKNDDEVSPELVQLLHYFEHTNDADGSVQDERILELQKNVKSVQENAEVGVRYMQLWEEMAMSRQDGYDEGQQYERARINTLTKKLLADNRMEDLLRAIDDIAYQEQLLKEYHL